VLFRGILAKLFLVLGRSGTCPTKAPPVRRSKLMRYGALIEKTKTGFSAFVPDLPGCVATGKTKEQVRRRLQEAVGIHLKSMMESGDAIPEPTSKLEYVEVQLAS
jgi:predicted RNase H-like HicB family nuclease